MFSDGQVMEPINSSNTPDSILKRYPHLNGSQVDNRFSIAECRKRGSDPIGICLDGPGEKGGSIAGVLAPKFKDWDGKANVTYDGVVVFKAATQKQESGSQIAIIAAGSAALIIIALMCFLTKKEKVIVEEKLSQLSRQS